MKIRRFGSSSTGRYTIIGSCVLSWKNRGTGFRPQDPRSKAQSKVWDSEPGIQARIQGLGSKAQDLGQGSHGPGPRAEPRVQSQGPTSRPTAHRPRPRAWGIGSRASLAATLPADATCGGLRPREESCRSLPDAARNGQEEAPQAEHRESGKGHM